MRVTQNFASKAGQVRSAYVPPTGSSDDAVAEVRDAWCLEYSVELEFGLTRVEPVE